MNIFHRERWVSDTCQGVNLSLASPIQIEKKITKENQVLIKCPFNRYVIDIRNQRDSFCCGATNKKTLEAYQAGEQICTDELNLCWKMYGHPHS